MDNKYLNGKIYKITSSQTDKIYIGSTIRTLNHRFNAHHYVLKNGSNIRSKEILQYTDAVIILIEHYPCNSKNELLTRERFYIENTDNVVNKRIPTRTRKEWRQYNSEDIRLSDKIYRENNIDKERLRHKKYYKNNLEKERLRGKLYRENNVEKEKLRTKKYQENNKDKLKAIRLYQKTWGGDNRYHNNLLRISLDIFQ